MKNTLLLSFFLLSGYIGAINCSIPCKGGNCQSIDITYTTDCAGAIETYEATYNNNDGTTTVITDETNPEFVGMQAGNLGSGKCQIKDCSI